MKALLLKEYYNLRSMGKILVVLIAFYVMLGVMQKDNTFFSAFIIFLMTFVSITTFNFDDTSKWDIYALSSSVSRRQIVAAKYLLGVLLTAVGVLISMVVNVMTTILLSFSEIGSMLPQTSALFTGLIVAGACLLMLAVIYPLIFRFGSEKARYLMFIIIAIPVVALFLLGDSLEQVVWSPALVHFLLMAFPFVVLAALFVSYRISVKIYEAKNF